MWFKNAKCYKLSEGFDFEQLSDEKVEIFSQFQPCLKQQPESIGFVAPISDDDNLAHNSGDLVLMCIQTQSRILPAHYVKKILNERIEQIKINEGRKVGTKERLGLRDEVVFDLLPISFTKDQKHYLYFDKKLNLLIVDTASWAVSDKLTSFVRECVGSLPCTMIYDHVRPMIQVDAWQREKVTMPGWEATGLYQIAGSDSRSVTTKGEVLAPEDYKHLCNGKELVKIGISYNEQIEFNLSSKCDLSGIKYSDRLTDQIYAIEDYETKGEQEVASFLLMANALTCLIKEIFSYSGVDNG